MVLAKALDAELPSELAFAFELEPELALLLLPFALDELLVLLEPLLLPVVLLVLLLVLLAVLLELAVLLVVLLVVDGAVVLVVVVVVVASGSVTDLPSLVSVPSAFT